jgi:hypothetical protein
MKAVVVFVMRLKSYAIIYGFVFLCVLLPALFVEGTASSEPSPTQSSIFLSCQKETHPYERLRCLIPYFEKLTRDGSALEAVAEAKKLQKEKMIDNCHLAAHAIGGENLRKNNNDVGKAFATCAAGCMEGCYHGVMEEYLSQSHDREALLNQLPHLCESVSHDLKLWRQCLHGVGHGLLRHDISLVEAVKLCRGFGEVYPAKTCIGGVMMQNMNSIMLLDEKTFRSKLAGMCDPIDVFQDQALKRLCVEQIGEGIMFYAGHDLMKSKEFCGELPLDDRPHCVKGAEVELGRYESGTSQ